MKMKNSTWKFGTKLMTVKHLSEKGCKLYLSGETRKEMKRQIQQIQIQQYKEIVCVFLLHPKKKI